MYNHVLKRIFPHGPLRREAGDGPHAYLDAHEELFAAHVPHALVRQRLLWSIHELNIVEDKADQTKKNRDYALEPARP